MTKPVPLSLRASDLEASQARRALEALRQGRPLTGDAAAPPLVAEVIELLLELMAESGGAAIVPLDAELTTQEAADLLGISRPTLVKYLEDGTLPFHSIGVHRRIKAADFFAYLEHARARQHAALDDLTALNQRVGLYD